MKNGRIKYLSKPLSKISAQIDIRICLSYFRPLTNKQKSLPISMKKLPR